MQEVTKVRDGCIQFREYYNNRRSHQGISGKQLAIKLENIVLIKQSEKIQFAKKSELNGLVTRFELVS